MSANGRRGGISPCIRLESRGGKCLYDGGRAGAGCPERRVELHNPCSDDDPAARISESNVQPGGLVGTGFAECEMDQRRGGAAAPAHLLADVEAVLPHGAGELEALLVAPLDQDVVAAQGRGNTVRSTAE